VVQVVVVVPAEISDLLLGANMRQGGGLPLCLIKEEVLGFFWHQDGVLLDVEPH
jgi:hypothetical protein